MKFRWLALLATLTLVSACSSAKLSTPSAPSAEATASDGSQNFLSTLSNSVWTGTSTTNYPATGHSGAASVTFTAPGSPNNGTIQATIAWTLAGTSTVFNGTASGTADNFVVDAPESQTHGCSTYHAQGTVNGNTFTGSYSGSCHNSATAILGDAGTFTLTRQTPPEPPVEPQITFCHVPPGNPDAAVTMIASQAAITAGHIPQHPLDYYGECKKKK